MNMKIIGLNAIYLTGWILGATTSTWSNPVTTGLVNGAVWLVILGIVKFSKVSS